MTPAARERWRVRAPLLLLSGIAWALLVAGPSGDVLSTHHLATMLNATRTVSINLAMAHHPPAALALGVALMVVAMMFPLLTAPLSHVRARNFSHRRELTIALFLAGYTLLWMVAATLIAALSLAVQFIAVKTSMLVSSALLVALVWQSSPVKQRCLNRSHAHPTLAAFGAAGYTDAFRFGITHAGWCVSSCWALMLLPWLMPRGHVLAMVGVSLWLIAERLDRPAGPCWGLRWPRKGARLVVVQPRIWLQQAKRRNGASRLPKAPNRPDSESRGITSRIVGRLT